MTLMEWSVARMERSEIRGGYTALSRIAPSGGAFAPTAGFIRASGLRFTI